MDMNNNTKRWKGVAIVLFLITLGLVIGYGLATLLMDGRFTVHLG